MTPKNGEARLVLRTSHALQKLACAKRLLKEAETELRAIAVARRTAPKASKRCTHNTPPDPCPIHGAMDCAAMHA